MITPLLLSLCVGGAFFSWYKGPGPAFTQLEQQLSSNASVILSTDPLFEDATFRWSKYAAPSFKAAVKVATEEDIQKTVLFSNKHSLPFVVVDGSHGSVPSLANVKNGVAILLENMKDIKIDESGSYADFDPGLTSGDILRYLWANKKWTSTGFCLCTGMTGVTLGGGHGILQGKYGLLVDNILEMRVVLANGTIAIASSESNPDLFWALRGAGHNFGVVTSMKYKIYDVPSDPSWTFVSMIFMADKLEQLFTAMNSRRETNQPAGLIQWAVFARIPEIDPKKPVIVFSLMYEGTADSVQEFASPFRALGPATDVTTPTTYPGIFALNGQDEESIPACGKGFYRRIMPVGLPTFNVSAIRAVFDMLDQVTIAHPGLNSSAFMSEGYSTQAVLSVPEESTATPFRSDRLLLSPVFTYTDPSLSDIVTKVAKDMRKILVEGSGSNELHAYVNYAFGDESLPEMYGHEPWRVPRLQQLKKLYDPKGRFNFYAPIRY